MLFAGTSEGREVAEYLSDKGIPSVVCVATEYASSLLNLNPCIKVLVGRLDKVGMVKLITTESPSVVIDATHPYATEVSRILRDVCLTLSVYCVRVIRPNIREEGVMYMTLDEVIPWLNTQEGVIFLSTGAKEAKRFADVSRFDERIYMRMLPSPEGIQDCIKLGYPYKNLICMQGPFSRQLNVAMFKETNAKILITKESGMAGGFVEKIEAAKECGMDIVVLVRPTEEEGFSIEQVKDLVAGI